MVSETKKKFCTISKFHCFTGNIVSSVPILHPLLGGLLQIPELSYQSILAGGATAGLQLNGPGGLIELLNSVLDFLSGLFVAIPNLLSGLPLSIILCDKNVKCKSMTSFLFLDKILSGLPNLNGILKGILPNTGCQCQSNPSSVQAPVIPAIPVTPVTSSLPILNGLALGDNTCNRCGALIDIHHNEINSVKIVLG